MVTNICFQNPYDLFCKPLHFSLRNAPGRLSAIAPAPLTPGASNLQNEERPVSPKAIPTVFLLFATFASVFTARAQSNNYTQTNLISNVPGLALQVDHDLLHPWGMAASANQPFRIALNGKGQFRSSSGGPHMTPQPTANSLSITASAGSVSHATVVTLNVQ
jgi:hypothetical protein